MEVYATLRKDWRGFVDLFLDGYADYAYNSVFDAAWQLAEKVPVDKAWAVTLGALYRRLHPYSFSVKDPLAVAQRWRLAPEDAESQEQEEQFLRIGALGHYQDVRYGLARLALAGKSSLSDELLSHDDVAVRCAVYASARLTPEQMQQAAERDGYLSFQFLVENERLWARPDTRSVLHDLAWSLQQEGDEGDLSCANRYRAIEKRLRNEHPQWFVEADEDEDEGEDDQRAARVVSPSTSGLVAISNQVATSAQDIVEIRQMLRGVSTQTNWTFLIALGIVAFLLFGSKLI